MTAEPTATPDEPVFVTGGWRDIHAAAVREGYAATPDERVPCECGARLVRPYPNDTGDHSTTECPTATPDADVRDGYAAVLRQVGFFATHSDRWNDREWQDRLWNDLAAALVASDHHHATLAAERQAAVAPFLALADDLAEYNPGHGDYLRASRLIRAAAHETGGQP